MKFATLRIRNALPLIASLLASSPASASLGIFEIGNGINAQGMGGISYVLGDETTVLAGNPALLSGMGERIDLGVNFLYPQSEAEFRGNAAGPDENYRNVGRRLLYIPQGGFSHRINEKWMLGATLFSAGLGPDSSGGPYQRFGGGHRTSLIFVSSGIVSAVGYKLREDQHLGFSLNLGYQTLRIEGLEFAAALSETPDKVTNQGKDGAFNVGFPVGWVGNVTEKLKGAVTYRSKAWTQKHKDYRGLLPDQGSLELPAIYGAGLAYALNPAWTLAAEYQRYQYSSQKSFGHRIGRLAQGNLLGSDNGPGFGYQNQDAYKLGLRWKATANLTLRLGHVTASQIIADSETFFGVIASSTPTKTFTTGGTYQFGAWEASGQINWSPDRQVRGRNSIPPAFGGGEANVSFETLFFGFSVGRRFGQ